MSHIITKTKQINESIIVFADIDPIDGFVINIGAEDLNGNEVDLGDKWFKQLMAEFEIEYAESLIDSAEARLEDR